jgi:uncharacterized membrane protein
MKIRKVILRVLLGLVVILTLFFGLIVYPYFANIVMPWQRSSAIESAIEWGGLAELPVSQWQADIDTEGGIFTRTFIIEFECSKAAIEKWVKESHGIRDVTPVREGNLCVYRSVGYENSIGGTVSINYETGTVYITMSWS